MSKGLEALECLEHIKKDDFNMVITTYPPLPAYNGTTKDEMFNMIEQALHRLESIDNANPSEALRGLEHIKKYYVPEPCSTTTYDYLELIKQALLKAQDLEKENELLKEIIKSLFDRGCPLHQYTDSEGTLQIEVDNECSIMHLGEFKSVDLDKKLKEVLGNE